MRVLNVERQMLIDNRGVKILQKNIFNQAKNTSFTVVSWEAICRLWVYPET